MQQLTLTPMSDVSVDNAREFTHISSYMKSSFGVWLLECPPELIPVWPPVVQQDYMIPVKNYSMVVLNLRLILSAISAINSVFVGLLPVFIV